MYQVFCDGLLMYDDRLENLRIFQPSIELEIGKTGSFECTIYPDHPHYDLIRKLKSIVTVWQDDFLMFRGRVLNEEIGFYNEKKITCEGDLSFLLDTMQRPFSFTGTAQELVEQVLEHHNMQVGSQNQFSVGRIADIGVLTLNLDKYTNTLETLTEGISVANGAYLQTRFEGGTAYLDLISDASILAAQEITFGKNLLTLKRTRKGEEVATAVIPIGKDGLTIESVNGGSDTLIDADAVSQYGKIVKTVEFRDTESALELMRQGQAYLGGLVNPPDTVELSAADLSAVGEEVTSFRLGTQVRVTSIPHGIDQRFLVSKLAIDLLDPAANKLTLGGVLQPFTAVQPFTPATDGKDGHDGEDATVLRIDSSRGTVFKNSSISTTLTVAIYHGAQRITSKAELVSTFGTSARLEWSWQRVDETTFGIISADDHRLRDDGFSLVLTPDDIDTKATFMCQMIL